VSAFATAHGELAGVPVFVVPDGPRVPVVGLTFRVGRADETAATSGLCHLVEHLALPATTATAFDFNGTVDSLFTSFFASGDLAELREFVRATAGLLRSLPEERFETERRILLAEESTRGLGGARQALALRFGPVGHGLPGYYEYGLRRLQWPEIGRWASTRFTAAAAALWIAGATIDDLGLEIELPDGGRREQPPTPQALDDLSTPAVYAAGSGVGVCLSFLAERNAATRVALDAYADVLRERLRYELALSYSIDQDLQALTADTAHLVVTADVADEHIADWLDEATATLDRLAGEGPSDESLARLQARHRRYDRDESAATGWAAACAEWELVGHTPPAHADYVADYDSVGSEQVASALARMRESLLVLGPDGTPVPSGFAEYPVLSSSRLQGRRHRPASRRDRMRRQLRDVHLVSSADGVASVSAAGWVTAPFDRTVLCIKGFDERMLLTDDGFFLPIVASAWTDGADLLAEIDASIPDELVVPDWPAPDERAVAVHDLARSTFRRTWLVSEELRLLPELLEEGELPLVLAKASRGWRLGLLALTDRRLHFLYENGSKHSFAVSRDSIGAVAKGSTLSLDLGDESVKLTDVDPKDKAAEIARLLGDR
jgi:zinc protease